MRHRSLVVQAEGRRRSQHEQRQRYPIATQPEVASTIDPEPLNGHQNAWRKTEIAVLRNLGVSSAFAGLPNALKLSIVGFKGLAYGASSFET